MVTELTKLSIILHSGSYTHNSNSQSNLEILATGLAVDVDSLTVIVFMRIGG